VEKKVTLLSRRCFVLLDATRAKAATAGIRGRNFKGGRTLSRGLSSRKDGQCTVEILCAGSAARRLRLNHVGEALKPLGREDAHGCRSYDDKDRNVATRPRCESLFHRGDGLAGLPWLTYRRAHDRSESAREPTRIVSTDS